MFRKVLVANRGEIALRVIRACRELGISVAVAHSETDRASLPVRLADQAICIGPGPSARSYLSVPAIIQAALLTGAEAIHPGYGYLAENTFVAEICERYGIAFVGPRPAVLEQVGDKAQARQLMRDAGLPVLPGSDGPVRSLDDARAVADRIGYPILLKAAAGGGGRGMRLVEAPREIERAFVVAQAEARGAFGRGDLYIERFVQRPRHVEVQVLHDHYGAGIHLGERDCSVQRRYQKLVEESPAPGLPRETCAAMARLALVGAHAIGYTNAGTLEFLVDEDGAFFFIEINARIQVEHPVTEALTGIDLVKWQLRIAAGEPLSIAQKDIVMRGHALECRIVAEDAERGLQSASGRIVHFLPPGGPGIRVDSHVFAGYEVPPYYDSLLAKIIAWGVDRVEALARMERALGECELVGVPTALPLLQRVLRCKAFREGRAHTGLISEVLAGEPPVPLGRGTADS